MRTFFFLPILLSCLVLAGCDQGTRDWLSGVGHVQCEDDEYVTTNVENKTNKSVAVYFCSSGYKLPQDPTSFDPQQPRQEEGTRVGTDEVTTEVMYGDSCEEASYEHSKTVGKETPMLNAADQLSYQICYTPETTNPDGTSGGELYSIIGTMDTCPNGATVLDQSSVVCL